MAFTFDWQSEGFSYATAIGSQKKSKKKTNAPPADANGLADCNEDAAQLASKKLSMFPVDDSSEKSVTGTPVENGNLKSSLKSSNKRKKLSVSFFENSSEFDGYNSHDEDKSTELNGTTTEISMKNDKKMKKAAKKLKKEQEASVSKSTAANGPVAKKLKKEQEASVSKSTAGNGLSTVIPNPSENGKFEVNFKKSVGEDSTALESSAPTEINNKQMNEVKLSKKQIKQIKKENKKACSEKQNNLKFNQINPLHSQKQSGIEVNGNELKHDKLEKEKAPNSKVQKKTKNKKDIPSPSPSVSLQSNDKTKNNLEIKNISVSKTEVVTEVVKSTSEDGDDDDWSDCEDEFSHVSDDGPEVQEFDEEAGDDKLDEAFHKDLKNLLDDLDFEGIKKKMKGEAVPEEEPDCLDEEEEEMEDESDDDASDNEVDESEDDEDASKLDEEDSDECMEEDSHEEVILNKKETSTSVSQKSEANKKSLPTVNASKLSASLALFGQQQPSSSAGPAAKSTSTDSLVQKMRTKLNVAKFRMINEQLYSTTGSEALELFKREPESFRVYHDGFKSQVALWPLNPLDVIVDWFKQQPRQLVVADFGCGEAELSERVSQRVHSLDLVATKPQVTVCDMARTPLGSQSVDVAVFCLSLMGTNVTDFIAEANRTLKLGGILKIAEVESRISNLDEFVAVIQKFGFKCNKKPINHQYFVSMDFKKFKNSKSKDVLPQIKLKPCLYKKR